MAPAAARRAVRRVVLLGGDADGNLGDRAILQGMCDELRALVPDVALTVVSADPARAARDYGATVLAPGPAGFGALIRAARAADLVLCGGGGLFQDDDSLVKMPYWAARVACMRLACRRVIGFSLGVGPLDAATSRLAARLAFACMERVSVRDAAAHRVASPLNGGRPVTIAPDPALLLRSGAAVPASALLREAGLGDGRPLIGVAPRRWFPPRRRLIPNKIARRIGLGRQGSDPLGERLPALLAASLDRAAAVLGARIVFLPTYTLDHEADDRVCEAIRSRLGTQSSALLRIDDAPLYQAVLARLSVVLGGRMHPTILASAVGTPVVGLAYNPKFRGFFDSIGAGDLLLDVQSFVANGETDRLAEMLIEAAGSGRRPTDRIEALRARTRDALASAAKAA